MKWEMRPHPASQSLRQSRGNMQQPFYERTIAKLLKAGTLRREDRMLIVCGGIYDWKVFTGAGISDVTISNLGGEATEKLPSWERQDAENLTYPDKAFDVVVVHNGLHHCFSPHRGLMEMYRVARRLVVVFEARDSFALRVSIRLGLTCEYELEPVVSSDFVSGGAGNGPLPNYVYRWTEREVVKAIASCDPARVPSVEFFHGFRLPLRVGGLARAIASVVGFLFPGQGNQFAFAISKEGPFNAWIEERDGAVAVNPQMARKLAVDQSVG